MLSSPWILVADMINHPLNSFLVRFKLDSSYLTKQMELKSELKLMSYVCWQNNPILG